VIEAIATALNGRRSGGHDPAPVVAVSSFPRAHARMRLLAAPLSTSSASWLGSCRRAGDDYEERSAVLN